MNLLVRDAYDAAASDIHLEATRTGLAARFRVDGVLVPAPEPPSHLHHAVVSRIKLLAELDIAERRRPQDGRIRVRLEARELDLRVSTVPTMYGESVVLRLLDRGGRPVDARRARHVAGVLDAIDAARRRGRTACCSSPARPAAARRPRSTPRCNVATRRRRRSSRSKIRSNISLPGITQMPVHRQAGVTFAAALRAILRQDPDVVMIGEMRDSETAEIAVQAAMTGHLVFSTLHTNDAIGAVPRLLDLGIPDYLVAATLEGVLAQRLVRRICADCRERTSRRRRRSRASRAAGRSHDAHRGLGCAACRGTGYRGRVGIFELLADHGRTPRRDHARRQPRPAPRHRRRRPGSSRSEPTDGARSRRDSPPSRRCCVSCKIDRRRSARHRYRGASRSSSCS